MTRSALLTASLALACLLGEGQFARAQFPYGGSPNGRPAVSPYINLLRGGASPAINYSTLVRPELDFRASVSQLQNQSLANQQAITGLAQGGLPGGPLVTGTTVGFQNHLIYFQTMTGGPGGQGFGFGTVGGGAGRLGSAGGVGPGGAPAASRGAGFGRAGVGGSR